MGLLRPVILTYPSSCHMPEVPARPRRILVAWFRRRPVVGTRTDRVRDDFQHLEQFVQSRRGVEAFLEPKTTVTSLLAGAPTVLPTLTTDT